MPTCKDDCLCYEACRMNIHHKTEYERFEENYKKKIDSSNCSLFKDRSKFIELPCGVGDTFYGFLNGYAKDFGGIKIDGRELNDISMIVFNNPDGTFMVVYPSFLYNKDTNTSYKGCFVMKRAKIEIAPLPDEEKEELWSTIVDDETTDKKVEERSEKDNVSK